jgi:hypothetical protein
LKVALLACALSACGDDDKEPVDGGDRDAGNGDASAEDGGSGDAGATGKGPVAIGNDAPLGDKCEGKAKANVAGDAPSFTRKNIADTPGAAFMRPVDVNDDGFPELVVTSISEGFDPNDDTGGPPLAPGAGYLLASEGGKPTGKLETWTSNKLFGAKDKLYWANNSELVDINHDGFKDLVIGGGFLGKPFGKLGWVKGTADGFETGLGFIPVPDEACWYHLALPLDMDGDGDEDFVTTCHVGTTAMRDGPDRTQWFENPGDGTDKFTAHEIGDGGGSLLTLHDLDDDGDLDVLLPQFFAGESLIWYEQTKAKGAAWKRHVISEDTGHGFVVKLADMNGDGTLDLVYANHNNEESVDDDKKIMGVYWFEVPAKGELATLENWDDYKHVIYEGFEVNGTGNADRSGAPGMINVGDIDGDCDIDVVASGDGDDGIYLFLQQADGFETVVLDESPANVNSGEIYMLDLDGDKDLDIVAAIFGVLPGPADVELHSNVAVFVQD